VSKTQIVLLATTAISITISGFLWAELSAERKLARRNYPDVVTHGLPETVRSTGSTPATSGPQNEQPGIAPPELNRNVEGVSSTTVPLSNAQLAQLTSMEFTGVRIPLDSARRQIARLYPELRTDAGLSDEDVETLAGLMARGAYPEELEKALGVSTYQRWVSYERTQNANYFVNSLQKKLPDAPLNEHQVSALALIIQDEQRWHDDQSPRQPPASDTRSKLETELRAAQLDVRRHARVVDRARALLSEEQILALQNDPYVKLKGDFIAALEAKRAELDKDGR
jgi:hypothetical protein